MSPLWEISRWLIKTNLTVTHFKLENPAPWSREVLLRLNIVVNEWMEQPHQPQPLHTLWGQRPHTDSLQKCRLQIEIRTDLTLCKASHGTGYVTKPTILILGVGTIWCIYSERCKQWVRYNCEVGNLNLNSLHCWIEAFIILMWSYIWLEVSNNNSDCITVTPHKQPSSCSLAFTQGRKQIHS